MNNIIFIISLWGNRGISKKMWSEINSEFFIHSFSIIFNVLGLLVHPLFYSVTVSWDLYLYHNTSHKTSIHIQLLDLIRREETLLNVIRSVTQNYRSLVLTTILGVILSYFFTIFGHLFFQDDFQMEAELLDLVTGKGIGRHLILFFINWYSVGVEGDPERERYCDSLGMCLTTTLYQGLRNGGGLGDILRKPSHRVRIFAISIYHYVFLEI